MAISVVAMATATLILFLDVVFELIIFFWFSCRQLLFTMSVFSEIRRKDLI